MKRFFNFQAIRRNTEELAFSKFLITLFWILYPEYTTKG